MSNKLSAVLILCMSTVGLAGCDLLRVSGPCYGVGCPGGTAGRNGQYKPGEAPKAQNASATAPAPTRTASAPAQSANVPAQTASAPAQPDSAQPANAQTAAVRPAPAQDASSEAKSSPLHSIEEFFARLIPHHNSGANSGTSN
jgi:hypothetical protein